jgi:cell division transport system permease protein
MGLAMDLAALRRLWSALRSGLRGVRATPLVFAISTGTMAAGLLLLGGYLLLVENMRGVIEQAGHGLRITAYVTAEASEESAALDALAARLRALPEVAAATYVSPDAALARLRSDLGREAGILEGLARNPLPASFEIEIAAQARSPEAARALAARLRAEPGVEDVRFGESWLEGYGRVLRGLEWGGAAFGAFLLLVLGAMVAGTVRLAVHARADEIQIQRLVGASGLFVRLPFYVEAALQGAVAAAFALGALYAFFRLGVPWLLLPLEFLIGTAEPRFLSPVWTLGIALLGVALGVGGAAVSLLRLDEQQS